MIQQNSFTDRAVNLLRHLQTDNSSLLKLRNTRARRTTRRTGIGHAKQQGNNTSKRFRTLVEEELKSGFVWCTMVRDDFV